MFEVWDRFNAGAGLGDAFQDCLNTVASTSADHVWRGQTVTVSGQMGAGIYLVGDFAAKVQTALNQAGFSQVSVSAPGLIGGGNWSVTVTANTDYDSINDVQSIVAGAVSSVGGPTGAMTSTKSQITPNAICAVWKGGSVNTPGGTDTSGDSSTPKPDPTAFDLNSLLAALGGGGAVLAIVAVIFLAKALK